MVVPRLPPWTDDALIRRVKHGAMRRAAWKIDAGVLVLLVGASLLLGMDFLEGDFGDRLFGWPRA